MRRSEKDILRDILIYYRNGIGNLKELYKELGREETRQEVESQVGYTSSLD